MGETRLLKDGDLSDELIEHSAKLFTLVDRLWQSIAPHLGSPNYTGCIVRLEQVDTPTGSVTIDVGDLGQHESRLIELATEKTGRLRREHTARGHVTSAQSRDPHSAKLGGAIVAKMLIISVAALTEEANEAFALCLARALGLLNRSEADIIAAIRQNKFYLTVSTDLEI